MVQGLNSGAEFCSLEVWYATVLRSGRSGFKHGSRVYFLCVNSGATKGVDIAKRCLNLQWKAAEAPTLRSGSRRDKVGKT